MDNTLLGHQRGLNRPSSGTKDEPILAVRDLVDRVLDPNSLGGEGVDRESQILISNLSNRIDEDRASFTSQGENILLVHVVPYFSGSMLDIATDILLLENPNQELSNLADKIMQMNSDFAALFVEKFINHIEDSDIEVHHEYLTSIQSINAFTDAIFGDNLFNAEEMNEIITRVDRAFLTSLERIVHNPNPHRGGQSYQNIGRLFKLMCKWYDDIGRECGQDDDIIRKFVIQKTEETIEAMKKAPQQIVTGLDLFPPLDTLEKDGFQTMLPQVLNREIQL